MNGDDGIDSSIPLETIAERVRSCDLCPLHLSRKNAVPGEGPTRSAMMFVGEAPGDNEDRFGRPFVGMSGKLLTKLLREAGVDRSGVFITSVLKCRPPGNRRPNRDETKACRKHLEDQIRAVSPKVIIALGGVSYDLMASLFSLEKGVIGEMRGKVLHLGGDPPMLLLPTYHPAGLIYNRKLVPLFLEDVRMARELSIRAHDR